MRFHAGDIRRTCCTICIASFLLTLPFSARAEAASKNVLVLHSYHRGLSWTDKIMEGMFSVLQTGGLDLEIHVVQQTGAGPESAHGVGIDGG